MNCCHDGLKVGYDYAQDIDYNEAKYLLCNNGDISVCYGVSRDCANAWTNISNGKNTFIRKAGDVVTVEFSMKCWWIKFYVNDKLYGSMKIENRNTYYPVLFTTNSGQYQVVM